MKVPAAQVIAMIQNGTVKSWDDVSHMTIMCTVQTFSELERLLGAAPRKERESGEKPRRE